MDNKSRNFYRKVTLILFGLLLMYAIGGEISKGISTMDFSFINEIPIGLIVAIIVLLFMLITRKR